jgi:hypothetical protein
VLQFVAEMQPGSPSHATYHDPWADPDAYLSLISRMHGHDVALGIKEIMDSIIANEEQMKSYIKEVLQPAPCCGIIQSSLKSSTLCGDGQWPELTVLVRWGKGRCGFPA